MGNKILTSWLDDDPRLEALSTRLDKQSTKPYLREITRSQSGSDRAKTILSERKVAIKEAKPFAAELSRPGEREALPNSRKVHISLNLSLPKVNLRNISIPTPHGKHVIVGLAGVAVITLSILGVKVFSTKPAKDVKIEPTTANSVLADSTQKPEFDTITPDNKDAESLGGLAKISPPGNEPVFAFVDTIDNIQIRLTQQKLPTKFISNPDEEVKKLAEGYSAHEIINGTTTKAYLGVDVSGAQSVIFHKQGLLVFIGSKQKIAKDKWAEYINKLQ